MLTVKGWDAERWNGGVWEDPDEAGDIEIQHSGEASLPVEEVSPSGSSLPTSEGINTALSEETVMDSPEAVATGDRVESPPPPSQLDCAKWHSDIWLKIILCVSVRVFLEEINIWIGRLSKVGGPAVWMNLTKLFEVK